MLEWILDGILFFLAATAILTVLDIIRIIIKGVWKEINARLDERKR